jgi:trans-aconitate 2-methyltransferase
LINWNSDQYLKFQNERTQPAVDLVNRISLLHPKKIIDIGCGSGNSTRVLVDKLTPFQHCRIQKIEKRVMQDVSPNTA